MLNTSCHKRRTGKKRLSQLFLPTTDDKWHLIFIQALRENLFYNSFEFRLKNQHKPG